MVDMFWTQAINCIPNGTQTLSKAPERFVEGVTPKFIRNGKGSHVWDTDGKEYIDYPCALGAILLGYCDDDVDLAVMEGMKMGNIFTLPNVNEGNLARLLINLIPCAEMVRFAKNGSDVTMGAVRVARAYTGRDHIAFCGYHGCQDWYAITGGLRRGIPKVMGQLIHGFRYNDLNNLEHVLKKNKCACVIMEQGLDEPKDGFLHNAIELAHKYGALFILDEMVTGFRYDKGGAQKWYDIMPDLATFGKAMGNGYSIAALVGKKEIMRTMEDGVFFSFTYGGEMVGINAAMAVINQLYSKPVNQTLWANGAMLLSMLERMKYDVGLWLHGNPVRFIIKFKDDFGREDLMAKSYFLQETVKRGILMGVPTFTTFAHTREDLIKTIEVCDFVLSKMEKIRGDYEHHLEGKPIAPPIIRT